MANQRKKKSLYLIDGSGYLFRAFFAIRSLSNSEGFPTNALYGFTAMVMKLIEDERPDYVAVAFDTSGRQTFRQEIYPDYKANRKPQPPALVQQVPVVRELTRAFNLITLEDPRFEADDIIATLAHRAQAEDVDTVVVTSDKDLMQLVGARCVLLDTMKNVRYDAAAVHAKMGVRPDQVLDLLALMGDSSDNIPGVTGIGAKTAAALLNRYETLDGVYEHIDDQKGKRRENLAADRQAAYLSRRLAALRTDVPLTVTLADLAYRPPDLPALTELFGRLEFRDWLRKYHDGGATSDQPALSREGFGLVRTREALDELASDIADADRVALCVHATDPHPVAARLVGLSVAVDGRRASYIPLTHATLDAQPQLQVAAIRETLGPLLADPATTLSVADLKYTAQVLAREGIQLANVRFDAMLASYLLDAGRFKHSLDNIALTWLDHKAIAFESIAGKGKKQKRFDALPVSVARDFACERAQLVWLLSEALEPRLAAEDLASLLADMELPLARVLADMETTGVKIDVPLMRRLSAELGERARALEAAAHEAAGRAFALGSPKQLAQVLFSELGLPPKKKTRTGLSTDSGVLEELSALHPLPALVLEWRQLSKLKSTYTDVLPTLVRPETGRIHTIFNQAVAATGRLSSQDPNLQNIPIRTAEGRRIRQGFIPDAGKLLVSADYSQIELRILAHLSGDTRMLQSFRDGADIHRRTAAEILGIDESTVTPDQRGMAKTINFGILYGMSAFRLANEQGISRGEAKDFIDRYYARYPAIRQWKEQTLNEGRNTGFVSTMFGRIRGVAELRSNNGIARRAAERVAVNTPVQGTAADIIKAAMVRLHPRLRRELPDTKMVLQVHDELVFEVPEADVDQLIAVATEEMSGVLDLDVPLVVNARPGNNWLEAH